MTQHEYLQKLRRSLAQLPKAEQEKQVHFYAEMIADRIEDGMSEAEAVAALGDPAEAARLILSEMPLSTLVRSRVRPAGGWSAAAIVLTILGSPIWLPIALALLSVVLTVYVVLWVCVIVVFAVVLALLAASLLCIGSPIVGVITAPLGSALLLAGCGLVGLGITVLAFLGAVFAAKGIARLTGLLARWIKSFFIRKEPTYE